MHFIITDAVSKACEEFKQPSSPPPDDTYIIGFSTHAGPGVATTALTEVVSGDIDDIEAVLPADVSILARISRDVPNKGLPYCLVQRASELILYAEGKIEEDRIQWGAPSGPELYFKGDRVQMFECRIEGSSIEALNVGEDGWEVIEKGKSGDGMFSEGGCRKVVPPVCGSVLSQIRIGGALFSCTASVFCREGCFDRERVISRLRQQFRLTARRSETVSAQSSFEAAACHFIPQRKEGRLSIPITLVYVVLPMHIFFGNKGANSVSKEIKRRAPFQEFNRREALRVHRLLRYAGFGAVGIPVLSVAQRFNPFEQLRAEGGSTVFILPEFLAANPHNLLVSPHLHLTPPAGFSIYQVQSEYLYYHYRCDGGNDSGWGCAYRSLQTLLSWFALNGLSRRPAGTSIPSIKALQELLFEIDPSKTTSSFVGSEEWIGSAEIFLVLGEILGIECTMLHLQSGADLCTEETIERLVTHFTRHKTPVMIGGRQYAHTILGIARNDDKVRVLILDPHHSAGSTKLEEVLCAGRCAWIDPATLFKKDAWYNLCCPMLPGVGYW